MMDDQIWNLLAKKVANELLPEEEKELARLLQQHPDASYTKEILTQGWKDKQKPFSPEEESIALEKHKRRLESAMAVEEVSTPSRRGNIRRMTIRIAGVAAALTMAFFMGRKWWSQPKMDENLQQLVTHKGSRSQVKLPDGTTVWLNAGSKLDYPKQFTGNQREVTLEGEAFFTVAKDARRPFTVRTRTFSIRVLGTEFNVRAYPQEDSAVTSLLTGLVEVVLDEKRNTVIRLKPNEKLSVPTAQLLEEDTVEVDHTIPVVIKLIKSPLTVMKDSVITETAWVENKLAFKRLPLEKVAVMLEQWFGVDIRFKNETKKQEYLTGVFQNESLEEVLKALELTGSFHFKTDSDGIIWIE
ncbi:DUF4974 domain-containing protein [Chitinophaga sp. SYP-B3965]|uniref:FecR family protein n=1 Tax=Chitinophaga sp. SYP-B3965 TaxID=2663120 RepID=UPI001299804E|nr:FecR domain-containing protein [Chitinophaga sp. SYP-B3965]MRG47900.1 DUF4974 domain-containing protein [Chitinophaga sp. SYP-B3965]